jgi:ribosomal protein S18 acetylase RimI-like enzyme
MSMESVTAVDQPTGGGAARQRGGHGCPGGGGILGGVERGFERRTERSAELDERAHLRLATAVTITSETTAAKSKLAAAGTPESPGLTAMRLRDGETVAIGRVRAGDAPALCDFLDSLCLEALRFRFFTGAVDVAKMADCVAATGPDRLGLLALDRVGTVVGHAVCIELGDGRAEVAVEVADRLHGQGLGTILVERLAEEAERRGIASFVAQVLPENHAMLDVFRDGFDAHVAFHEGVDAVEFPTAAWRLARERYPGTPDTETGSDA